MNVDQLGYYRVNYPADDWAAFVDVLLAGEYADDDSGGGDGGGVLTLSDRTGLVNDAFRFDQVQGASVAACISKVKVKYGTLVCWKNHLAEGN